MQVQALPAGQRQGKPFQLILPPPNAWWGDHPGRQVGMGAATGQRQQAAEGNKG